MAYLLLVLAFVYCTVGTADEYCFKSPTDFDEAIFEGLPYHHWVKLCREKCKKDNPNADFIFRKECQELNETLFNGCVEKHFGIVFPTRHQIFEKFKNKMIEAAVENKKKVVREIVEKCASEKKFMRCSLKALKKGLCTNLIAEDRKQ
uniref:Uncharacterized protein n=1 Tax=Strigamia maritima TaxID=126957 RepID=T1ILZ4_STRMM